MNKLNKVNNIDELKVGDTVGYCRYIPYGWNRVFRYPIVTEQVIKRITPKRNKFVLDNGVELDKLGARRLVLLDDEAVRQTNIAKCFAELQELKYKISKVEQRSVYITETMLTDEELVELITFMKTLYTKHL